MDVAARLKDEGNKLFKEEKYAESREKYTEALKHDPSNAVIYSNRSLANLKLKSFEFALSDALECIKRNPQWSKGFVRKTMALEGLGRHSDVMQTATEGFRVCSEGQIKRALVGHWLSANQALNRLPEGSIELPRGVLVTSQEYLLVLACLMQSLSGERPLSLSLAEQCLFSCAEQMKTILLDFGETVNPIVKEWAKHLPHEVYPYSTNPVAKAKLEQEMKSRSEAFVRFLNKVDPALYPVLRPILGLIVLVVLNRTNILTECNTGHHAAELMNRALLPLFEVSLLSTDDYYSMYVGRICAVLDSFIGRGYRLATEELATVRDYCRKLEKAVQKYPRSLPKHEEGKDRQLAERSLSNVRNNILLPASTKPPNIPLTSSMSVELAEQIVKDKPQEVRTYIVKHLQELQSVKFLTMGEVEELLTMTGIFYELGEEADALKVFKKGEQAFFQVLGHMLSSNTIKLDQCPAAIAPMRQLALSEASLLQEPGMFASVILRWKCLFKELRTQLIRRSPSDVFGAFFQWYTKQLMTSKPTDVQDVQAALRQQMQQEELLLQTSAASALADMAETSYVHLQRYLTSGAVTVDYIFFAPLKENPLLEAYCVVSHEDAVPMVYKLDYRAIHTQAARVTKLLSQTSAGRGATTVERINAELTLLAKVVFPQHLVELLSTRRVTHLYISPDSDIARVPIDLLPVSLSSSPPAPLFELFSVSILPSMRELFSLGSNSEVAPNVGSDPRQVCSIVGNPNFNLCKPPAESFSIETLVNYLCEYFVISDPAGPILEQLKHSQDEVDFISRRLQSHGLAVQNLIGDKALLSNVLSLQSPLLIHVSSHAYSSTGRLSAFRGNFFDDLQSSAIALAGFNTYSRKQFDKLQPECGPGQLPPLAIFSMKLRGTKLVYLSTCESAAGMVPMQEAIDSLANAFLTAGAATVIASLWPVADQLAAEFSKLFYDKLLTPNTRPSEALNYAKKCFKERDDRNHSHWSCYAAFVCYGLDKPLLT